MMPHLAYRRGMDAGNLHGWLLASMFGFAAVTALVLTFITAPYGRHVRAGWGPQVPARLGWVVMESPAVVGFIAIYAYGAHRAEVVPLVLLGLWQFHYVQRTVIYPLRMRPGGRPMPVLIVLLAFVFQSLNGFVNARWISELGAYPQAWLADPRLWLGAAVFFTGWVINMRADATLRALRRPGDSGYRIPRGGLYEHISCPNYFGELLEWTGWAIATWSLAGLAFAVYTAANLVPRALANHRWYRETFPEYPATRRALIPFVV
jgi:steroid 5-alpha reductase family enzyme